MNEVPRPCRSQSRNGNLDIFYESDLRDGPVERVLARAFERCPGSSLNRLYFRLFFVVNPRLYLSELEDPRYMLGVVCGLLGVGLMGFTIVNMLCLGSQVHFKNNVLGLGIGVTVHGVAICETNSMTRDSRKGMMLGLVGCFSGSYGHYSFSLGS